MILRSNKKKNELPTISDSTIKNKGENNTIYLTVYEDNVNTKIAWFDSFDDIDGLTKEGSLLNANKGTYTIPLR